MFSSYQQFISQWKPHLICPRKRIFRLHSPEGYSAHDRHLWNQIFRYRSWSTAAI